MLVVNQLSQRCSIGVLASSYGYSSTKHQVLVGISNKCRFFSLIQVCSINGMYPLLHSVLVHVCFVLVQQEQDQIEYVPVTHN